MLAARHRLTDAADFRRVTRRGSRAGGPLLVVHLLEVSDRAEVDQFHTAGADHPRVGFVVSKAVGNAVVRNRVKRRLRALVRERLDLLGPRVLVVVRATAAAAEASYGELGAELERCLTRATEGPPRRPGAASSGTVSGPVTAGSPS